MDKKPDREEFMSPEELEILKRYTKLAASPFSKILFIGLAIAGLAIAIIGIISDDSRMIMIGVVWIALFLGLSFMIKWVGKDFKLDLAERRKVVSEGEIQDKKIIKEIRKNSVVLKYILVYKDIDFDVSEDTFTRFDKNDPVTIHYSKHARALLLIHSR